jgi:hypothetical protein
MLPYHSMRTREEKSPSAESHIGGRNLHSGVLPGASKGLLMTVLSQPQCLAPALGPIPHNLP